jgi:hypothetical protein
VRRKTIVNFEVHELTTAELRRATEALRAEQTSGAIPERHTQVAEVWPQPARHVRAPDELHVEYWGFKLALTNTAILGKVLTAIEETS